MSIRHAKTYAKLEDDADQIMLIRPHEDGGYYWCHVHDGSVHGSSDSEYIRFTSLWDAINSAKTNGYSPITDGKTNVDLLKELGLYK